MNYSDTIYICKYFGNDVWPFNYFCAECGHGPCIFLNFVIDYVRAISRVIWHESIESTVDTGDVCAWSLWKKLYTGVVRFNIIIGTRQKSPTWVETGFMLLYPSPCHIGFKRKRNEEDNSAVDISRNKIK